MRQLFFLAAGLLILQMFLPELGGKLEDALIAFLDFATVSFAQAQGTI